jgi:hypothetical protein
MLATTNQDLGMLIPTCASPFNYNKENLMPTDNILSYVVANILEGLSSFLANQAFQGLITSSIL